MTENIEIIFRSIVAFCWLWVFTLLIGNQFLKQGTYHLFAVSTMLGTISGNMAFNIKISFLSFVLSMGVISILGYVLMLISLKNKKARKWISGESLMLIRDGNVLTQQIRKANLSLDLLEQKLREKEVFNISEVDTAILETCGTLSVLKKNDYQNATKQDLEKPKEPQLPTVLIADGKVVNENLIHLGIDYDWLMDELLERKIKQSKVFFAILSIDRELFCFGKESLL